MINVSMCIRTISEANARGHWSERAKRAKLARLVTAQTLKRQHPKRPTPPLRIRITRYSAGKLDGDNLQGALKAVRDGVQDWLGIDDGSELLAWEYAQEPCPRSTYGVRVEVEEGE